MRALLLALLLLAAATGAAPATTLGEPRVGFSAERLLVFDGRRYVGRIWQMPGVQRHEQELQGLRPAFILRSDSAVGEIVLASLHTVVEFALPEAFAALDSPQLLHRPQGGEIVNGIATTRYAVDLSVPAGHAKGSLWLSNDGIPVRCEGSFTTANGHVSRFRWELRNLKLGPQDPELFEIPKGYSKLPAEAVTKLLGMRLKPAKNR
jgi:hypothetical protein